MIAARHGGKLVCTAPAASRSSVSAAPAGAPQLVEQIAESTLGHSSRRQLHNLRRMRSRPRRRLLATRESRSVYQTCCVVPGCATSEARLRKLSESGSHEHEASVPPSNERARCWLGPVGSFQITSISWRPTVTRVVGGKHTLP